MLQFLIPCAGNVTALMHARVLMQLQFLCLPTAWWLVVAEEAPIIHGSKHAMQA
jgi:hypothetical protein